MLNIKNLFVEANGQKILKGINLQIKAGEVHVLLGPNASGKTTLSQAIMGFPGYAVSRGQIIFNRQDITQKLPEERARAGLALAFQHPPVIRGVSLNKLLAEIARTKIETDRFITDKNLLARDINAGFSGGERKLSEIMQVVALRPKLAIFDELDAGLDPKNLAKIVQIIKTTLIKKGVALLIITHQGEILDFLNPDMAHVMLDGKIICTSPDWQKIWRTIKEFDYEKCKDCQLLAN